MWHKCSTLLGWLLELAQSPFIWKEILSGLRQNFLFPICLPFKLPQQLVSVIDLCHYFKQWQLNMVTPCLASCGRNLCLPGPALSLTPFTLSWSQISPEFCPSLFLSPFPGASEFTSSPLGCWEAARKLSLPHLLKHWRVSFAWSRLRFPLSWNISGPFTPPWLPLPGCPFLCSA